MELNEVVVKVDRSKIENGQYQSNANVTTRKQQDSKKKTSKGLLLTKYVALFSFILVAVVLSTTIASYVSTKIIMKSIPNQNERIVWTMPEWNIFDILQSNFTDMKNALQRVIKNETKSASELVLQSFLNETDIENKIKNASELVLQHFLNETDFLSWKMEMRRKIYTMIHLSVCVNNCIGANDGDYQSCYTCEGFVSCSNGILNNKTCVFGAHNKMFLWDDIKKRCDYSSSTCNPDYLQVLNQGPL